jgi:hypothetical protein
VLQHVDQVVRDLEALPGMNATGLELKHGTDDGDK